MLLESEKLWSFILEVHKIPDISTIFLFENGWHASYKQVIFL